MAIPHSPYIAGKAISGARGFSGRDDVFRLVQTVLEQSDSNAIVLFGQRRIGKTSILLNLQQRLPSPPFVTVFFDLQDRARKPIGEVLYELAQTIALDLDLEAPDKSHFDDNGAGFRETFLPAVYQTLGEQRRLVLLFDEFDVLDSRQEEKLSETSAARAFIPAMRRLINEEPRLGFVFVVGRKADELSVEFMSAFKAARFYRISVLDPDAARALVLTAQREGTLVFTKDVPDRVQALTAGHPYFTQLLCQLLFERAYASATTSDAMTTPIVTLADVEALAPKAIEAGEHIFEWIWDGLPPAERVIFSAMAAGTDEHTVITQDRLLDVLQAQGIRILIRELELAPKTLIDWQMLKEVDGGYQFFVELMRRWVAERKPLPRVKEELDRINPLADTLYQGAAGFYRSGELEPAADQLQTALRVNPNHLQARLLLGEIYKIQGKHDDAVRELAEAYRIDPDGARLAYENALLQQAEACEQRGRFDDATAAYGAALAISPHNRAAQERKSQAELAGRQHAIAAYSTRAAEYEQAERWDDAVVAYQHLISLSDDQRWREALARAERERDLARRYGEGLVLMSQRQWNEAQKAFALIVAERPGYKDAADKLAQATKAREDSSYDLTTRRGSRTFRLAWLATCLAGWLLGLALIAAGWWRVRTPLDYSPGLALAAIGLALLVNLLLQVLLLRRFMSATGRRRWVVANAAGAGSVGGALLLANGALSVVGSTSASLLLAPLAVALFGSVVVGLLQERLCLIPELGLAPTREWTLPTAAGRLLGIAGAVVFVTLLERQAILSGLAEFVRASQYTALFIGATIWALISGGIAAVVMARRLTLAMNQGTGQPIDASLAFHDRRLQTWLPVGLVGLSLLVLAASAVRVVLLSDQIYPLRTVAGGWSDLALAHDGQRYIAPDNDPIVYIRDNASGEAILRLSGHWGQVNSAGYSSDGTQIVTAGNDATVWVWDALTGAQRLQLNGHTGVVNAAAFSPDGTRIVTAADDATARVWDAETGAQLVQLNGHESLVLSTAYSPDGTRIVTASADATARVWDAEMGEQLLQLDGHGDLVQSAGYSPDGTRIVTAADDTTARVWDAETGEQLLQLDGHEGSVQSAAYSPDGARIVTASADETVRVWDGQTGEQLLELSGFAGWVFSAAYSSDGTMIVGGGGDATARVWEAESGATLLEITGHTDVVRSAAFSPDGTRIVTASDDGTARLWDAETGTPLVQLGGHLDAVRSANYSLDGTRIVTAANDWTARLWDAQSGFALMQLGGHADALSSAAFSPDGTRIVTASDDTTAVVWDAETGEVLRQFSEHTDDVHFAAFSPDSARIVTASLDTTARVWDAQAGLALLRLKGHTGWVLSAVYSPDGTRILTASSDDTARVWDAQTGEELLQLAGHTSTVNAAGFSSDGALIVTASDDGTARVWDAETARPLYVLGGFRGPVQDAVFSPDDRQVFANAAHEVLIFELPTGAAEPG